MSAHNYALKLKIADKILRDATPLLLAGYSEVPGNDLEREKLLGTETKSSIRDLVTKYDKDVELFLTRLLRAEFPNDVILGEESLSRSGQSLPKAIDGKESFWLIDPIDGTKNYCRAYPYFCSTMAFVVKQNGIWTPMVGLTWDPLRLEMFSSSYQRGAFLNGTKLKVSGIKSPDGALFSSGFAAARKGFSDHAFSSFRSVSESSLGVRRGGSAALDLAYVAAGRIDGYWERGLDAWDTAAGVLLVNEAGGAITHFDGGYLDFLSGEIVATNASMHSWLLKILSK